MILKERSTPELHSSRRGNRQVRYGHTHGAHCVMRTSKPYLRVKEIGRFGQRVVSDF